MIKTILVDDEPAVRERYSSYIQGYGGGFTVAASCSSAAEAFAATERIRPALILTEIRMPGEDGLSLLRRLRDSGWKGLAAVVSSYGDFAFAQSAIRLEVFDFLLKPAFPDDLDALLGRAALKLASCPDPEEEQASPVRDFVRATLAARSSDTRSPRDLECGADLPEPVRKAIAFLEGRFDSRFSLAEVAQAACVSTTWLNSCFRRIYGCSLMEYARILRVGKARELLAETDMPIKQIADLLAFPDQPTFSKLFGKVSGINPGAFRKSLRAEAP